MGSRAMTSLHPLSDMCGVPTRRTGTLELDTLVPVPRWNCDKLPNAERKIWCLSGVKRAECTATRGGDDRGNPEAAGRTHDGDQLNPPPPNTRFMALAKGKCPPRDLGSSHYSIIPGLFFPKTRFPLKRGRSVSRSRGGWLLTNWLAFAHKKTKQKKNPEKFVSFLFKSSVGRGFRAAGVRVCRCAGAHLLGGVGEPGEALSVASMSSSRAADGADVAALRSVGG